MLAIASRGATTLPDRTQRPRAALVRRLMHLARQREVEVRLVPNTRGVAEKVYGPAGFVYDDGQEQQRRPRMHLPVTTARP